MPSAAHILVPSRLPPEADSASVLFAHELREQVVLPLFGAKSREDFGTEAADLLARGSLLRFRWLASLVALPEAEQEAAARLWLQPPSLLLRAELQQRAARLLGSERSFQLERALALSFTDTVEFSIRIQAQMSQEPFTSAGLVHSAQLAEASAAHDLLCIGWMMELLGDVPPPTVEVAHSAAALLLEETARRLEAMRSALDNAAPSSGVALPEIPREWLDSHPSLRLPALLLLGLGLGEPTVKGLELKVVGDPEIPGYRVLRVCASQSRGEEDRGDTAEPPQPESLTRDVAKSFLPSRTANPSARASPHRSISCIPRSTYSSQSDSPLKAPSSYRRKNLKAHCCIQ
jgi:hypothetical protein